MGTPRKTPYIAETFAVTDQSGKRHTLRYWKNKLEIDMLSGETTVIHEGWKIDSTDGRHVNKAGDGTLTFADTGEALTKL